MKTTGQQGHIELYQYVHQDLPEEWLSPMHGQDSLLDIWWASTPISSAQTTVVTIAAGAALLRDTHTSLISAAQGNRAGMASPEPMPH